MVNMEESMEYYYVVRVKNEREERFVFNSRTFVVNRDFAKRYSSRPCALRVAREVRALGYTTEILPIPYR